MSTTQINLDMFRGDTAAWDVLVTRNGSPTDLAGGVLTFSARRNYASPILFQRTSAPGDGVTFALQSGATLGQATVELHAADTTQLSNQLETLVYDVHFRSASGDEWTVAWGNLTVNPSVSTP